VRKDCPDWSGPGVQAVARVRLVPEASRQVFEKELGAVPAVLSAWHVIGEVDYEVRLRCRDLAALGAALRDLRRCRGAATVSADLMVGEVPGLPASSERRGS
jgi:DNA-binding Lrp family transcriptional regulator